MSMIKPYKKCQKCGMFIVSGTLCEDCKPKTNGDRIRQMADEELADVIGFNECKDTAQGYECQAWIQPHCDGECKKHFLAWLKQEVSEDAGTD